MDYLDQQAAHFEQLEALITINDHDSNELERCLRLCAVGIPVVDLIRSSFLAFMAGFYRGACSALTTEVYSISPNLAPSKIDTEEVGSSKMHL